MLYTKLNLIFNCLLNLFWDLHAFVTKTHLPKKKILNVPFFSQWESPKMANKFISGIIDEVQDPNWKSSGAKTKLEYKFWANNLCGMACLKMILKYKLGKKYKTVELAKEAEKYGVYKIYGKKIDGMFYKEFVTFISKRFKIKSFMAPCATFDYVLKQLSKENLFIASVSKHIRDKVIQNIKKGGHLVIVTGYDLNKKVVYINNPSGYYPSAQYKHEVSFKHFNKNFAHRGIVVKVHANSN